MKNTLAKQAAVTAVRMGEDAEDEARCHKLRDAGGKETSFSLELPEGKKFS